MLKKTKMFAARLIEFLSKYSFEPDPDVELAKINSIYQKYQKVLNDPRKDYLAIKSLCQYECQKLNRNKFVFYLSNALCFFILPFSILLLRNNHAKAVRGESCEYVKIDYSIAYQIPTAIRDKTKEILPCIRYLCWADLILVVRLFCRNRLFFPELFVKYVLWISRVRPVIDQQNPSYLICFCESSSSSSLRTFYCNFNSIKTVNITHGEEFISVRNAFSTFDIYYRWEITPKKLHQSMYMESKRAYTFSPAVNIKINKRKNEFLTIGFLWPSTDSIDLFGYAREIKKAQENYSVVVRPHPRELYRKCFYKIIKEFNFSTCEPKDVSVNVFLNSCDLVVGYNSALMVQADVVGVKTIYVEDEYFINLQKYHPYYQNVTSVPLSFLEAAILSSIGS